MPDAHRKLKVWQEAIILSKLIHNLSDKFPQKEVYGLTSQIRRASVSVASNIAEGSARRAPKEFVRFINIARGSLAELDTQIFLAQEFGYLNNQESQAIFKQLEFTSKLLSGLKKSISTLEK